MSDDQGFKGYSQRPPSFLDRATSKSPIITVVLLLISLTLILVGYIFILYAASSKYASPAAQQFLQEHSFVLALILTIQTFFTAILAALISAIKLFD